MLLDSLRDVFLNQRSEVLRQAHFSAQVLCYASKEQCSGEQMAFNMAKRGRRGRLEFERCRVGRCGGNIYFAQTWGRVNAIMGGSQSSLTIKHDGFIACRRGT